MSCSSDFISTSNIISALIGGLIGSIIIPIVKYYFTRCFNKFYVKLEIDKISSDENAKYKTHNLRIHNNSHSSLKNVLLYVKVQGYSENDIITSETIATFVKNGEIEYGLLSWAKNINNSNLPNINLNQGESADINLIRYHENLNSIEFASEQGFSDGSTKSRILLINNDYNLTVSVTAENIFKFNLSYKWDSQNLKLIKI